MLFRSNEPKNQARWHCRVGPRRAFSGRADRARLPMARTKYCHHARTSGIGQCPRTSPPCSTTRETHHDQTLVPPEQREESVCTPQVGDVHVFRPPLAVSSSGRTRCVIPATFSTMTSASQKSKSIKTNGQSARPGLSLEKKRLITLRDSCKLRERNQTDRKVSVHQLENSYLLNKKSENKTQTIMQYSSSLPDIYFSIEARRTQWRASRTDMASLSR